MYLEDDVYLPKEEERYEYVLNETGLIWAGTHRDTFTWPWNFAQVRDTCKAIIIQDEMEGKQLLFC